MKSLGLNPGGQKIWGKISCKQPWKTHWGQQKYWKSYRDETSHGFRFASNSCGAICWCLMSTLITNGSSQSILNLQNKKYLSIELIWLFWNTIWPEPIWIKVSGWWQISPQHQSTYLRGPESESIEIPLFRPKFSL